MKKLISLLIAFNGSVGYAGIKKVSPNEIRRVATEVGFKQSELTKVLCIAHYESTSNSLAISPTDDHGLMQINRVNLKYCKLDSVDQLYDIKTNLTCAHKIVRSKHFGWRMWMTNKFCNDSDESEDDINKIVENTLNEEKDDDKT